MIRSSFLCVHCLRVLGIEVLRRVSRMGKTLPPFSQLVEAERRR